MSVIDRMMDRFRKEKNGGPDQDDKTQSEAEAAEKPLYQLIRESLLPDGSLPETFSLPEEESGIEENHIRFADGALDGIAMYHMGAGKMEDESLLEEFISLMSERKYSEAEAAMGELTSKYSVLTLVDPLQQGIQRRKDGVDAGNIYRYAAAQITKSCKKEGVKVGLCLLELFDVDEEPLREAIGRLACSDEFTLYAVWSMRGWSDGREQIYAAAKHTHGWGRIHAITNLIDPTEEMQDWILREGWNNSVALAYTATECFEKARVGERLEHMEGGLSRDEYVGCGHILEALLDEGPMTGISGIEDAGAVLRHFLRWSETMARTVEDYEVIDGIRRWAEDKEIIELCGKLLTATSCAEMVKEAVKSGKALNLAEFLGIPYKEELMRLITEDFDENYELVCSLHPDEGQIDTLIQVFSRNLPLSSMATGPAEEIGIGQEFQSYQKLVLLIQELKPYPGKGVELLKTALQSPVVNNRNMAMNVLEEWRNITGRQLETFSGELYQLLERLKTRETNEKLRERVIRFLSEKEE